MRIVRGNEVAFSVTFYDVDGAVVTPTSAIVHLDYPTACNGRTTGDVALTQNGNAWEGTWDTSVAYPGPVYWSARSSGGEPNAADDGQFVIVANRANPAP